jgi:glycosyltransferase involved in cell wall biosynthesis
MDRNMRLAVLVSHPIQYFVPLFRHIAEREGVDLRVFYETRVGIEPYRDDGFGRIVQWDIPLLEGYSHTFLSSRNRNGGLRWSVVGAVLRFRPDVLILHGYTSPTNLLALLTAKVMGCRVLMRGDTRLHAGHVSPLRRWIKRSILGLCDGALSIGSLNRDYYASLGMLRDRIFFAPFSVDNAVFSVSESLRISARRDLRDSLGLPQGTVLILFASKLIRRKRAADLVEAFSGIAAKHPDVHLLVVGSGDQQCVLRDRISELGLERVHLLGFRNQSELPSLYAGCDFFVLPSDCEPWGLVVNEVMAAGLPVIVSDEVGAAPDLVGGTGAGLVYRCGDVQALGNCLESLLESGFRQKMAARAVEVIKEWDVSVAADAIVGVAMNLRASANEHA